MLAVTKTANPKVLRANRVFSRRFRRLNEIKIAIFVIANTRRDSRAALNCAHEIQTWQKRNDRTVSSSRREFSHGRTTGRNRQEPQITRQEAKALYCAGKGPRLVRKGWRQDRDQAKCDAFAIGPNLSPTPRNGAEIPCQTIPSSSPPRSDGCCRGFPPIAAPTPRPQLAPARRRRPSAPAPPA